MCGLDLREWRAKPPGTELIVVDNSGLGEGGVCLLYSEIDRAYLIYDLPGSCEGRLQLRYPSRHSRSCLIEYNVPCFEEGGFGRSIVDFFTGLGLVEQSLLGLKECGSGAEEEEVGSLRRITSLGSG